MCLVYHKNIVSQTMQLIAFFPLSCWEKRGETLTFVSCVSFSKACEFFACVSWAQVQPCATEVFLLSDISTTCWSASCCTADKIIIFWNNRQNYKLMTAHRLYLYYLNEWSQRKAQRTGTKGCHIQVQPKSICYHIYISCKPLFTTFQKWSVWSAAATFLSCFSYIFPCFTRTDTCLLKRFQWTLWGQCVHVTI